MSDESSGGGSKVEVPQSEGTVPRSRQSELSIRGDRDILNEVRVSSQALSWNTVLVFSFSSQVPDYDSLISRSRNEGVWVFAGGSETSDPSVVSL